MPWVGPYYYRSVRVNGKPRRQYVGSGPIAQMASQLDEVAREQKALARMQVEHTQSAAEALDDDLAVIERLADVLARAALVAAGFHQHHRGVWRRKRENE